MNNTNTIDSTDEQNTVRNPTNQAKKPPEGGRLHSRNATPKPKKPKNYGRGNKR